MTRLSPILILGFVGFVTSFGAHIVAVNLPFYADQVGIGVAMIGLLIAAYDLAEIAAKPLFWRPGGSARDAPDHAPWDRPVRAGVSRLPAG